MTPLSAPIHALTHGAYRLGFAFFPDPGLPEQIIPLLARPPGPAESPLAGRRAPVLTEIPGMGPVAIKFYTRGGLVRSVNQDRYLRLGKTRAQTEFFFLQAAAAAGVNVPEPLGFASRGRFWYRAWLMTRAIVAPQTLAALCQQDPGRAGQLIPAVTGNIQRLIASAIHHVDLHPGNILVDADNTPYIIDFDRARYFSGSSEKLWKKYQQRWQRAIHKHQLPDGVNNALAQARPAAKIE